MAIQFQNSQFNKQKCRARDRIQDRMINRGMTHLFLSFLFPPKNARILDHSCEHPCHVIYTMVVLIGSVAFLYSLKCSHANLLQHPSLFRYALVAVNSFIFSCDSFFCVRDFLPLLQTNYTSPRYPSSN